MPALSSVHISPTKSCRETCIHDTATQTKVARLLQSLLHFISLINSGISHLLKFCSHCRTARGRNSQNIKEPQSIYCFVYLFSSVQFSRSVVSDSLQPHELQHARPPCPSPSPGVHSDSTESVLPSSHLILSRPFLLLPPILPSISIFSSESTL